MSPRFRFLFTAILMAVSLLVVGSSFTTEKPAFAARPNRTGNKVTICHRTHATTNPYRRITVSVASIESSGHQGASHDRSYPATGPSVPSPNVYNPATTYPSNQKNWGDIIPDTGVDGSGNPVAINAAKTKNFTGVGVDIYNGTGLYAGLCVARSTSQFIAGERAAGIPDSEILEDIKDQDSHEDDDLRDSCGADFSGCTFDALSIDPTAPTTVAPTTVAPTTVAPTTVAPTTVAPTTVAPTTPDAAATTTTAAPGSTGSIKGVIWIDMNRNGEREENEPFLQNTKVVATKSGSTSASALSNSSGLYEIKNVAPGTWTLVAELTAAELERVYDTTGTADWSATAVVVAGGVGQADFAAAGKSTISLSLLKTSAKAVVAKWAGSDQKFCSSDDLSFTGTAKNGELKLSGIPAGSYRVASDDPCDDGVAYVRAAVKKAAVVKVSFAPELPATGSSREMPLTLVALLMLALGVALATPRRRVKG